jgi:CheY-like chemotaxis protein
MSQSPQELERPAVPPAAAALAEQVVLVIDGDPCTRELLRLHLSNAGYKVLLAEDAVVGVRMVLQHAPDLILSDVSVPYLDSLELLTALRADRRAKEIPLVFLGTNDAGADRALSLGAQGYLTKPVRADRLLALVAEQFAQRRSRSAKLDAGARKLRILLADDNRDTVSMLTLLLRDEGHEVQAVYNGVDVLRMARHAAFDAVILDIEMPQMSGYAVAQDLRTLYYGARAPLLIAISGKWNRASEKLLAQMVGFDHHLEKPCDPNALIGLLAPLASPARPGS